MRKVALLAVLTLVASQAASADVVRHGSIPEAYRGRWIAGAGAEPERSVIVLSAKTYVSREARCRVDWVSQTAGARGSIYSAHLQCFNREETAGKKMISNLIIWPDSADQIAVGPEFTSLRIFHRYSAMGRASLGSPPSEAANLDESECQIDGVDVSLSRAPGPSPSCL